MAIKIGGVSNVKIILSSTLGIIDGEVSYGSCCYGRMVARLEARPCESLQEGDQIADYYVNTKLRK